MIQKYEIIYNEMIKNAQKIDTTKNFFWSLQEMFKESKNYITKKFCVHDWGNVANNKENRINKCDKKCLKIATKASNSTCFV